MEALLQDLRFGGRGLLRDRAFTAVALVTFALGIGANTAIFSIVDAVLVRPLPYADPDRLVAVWPDATFLRAEYVMARERSRSFDEPAAFQPGIGFSLSTAGTAERVIGARISANLLKTLGVVPVGRGFTREEESGGRGDVVLLSHGFWRERYASDAGMIGRALTIDGAPHTVIGIMPTGFAFPDAQTSLWLPLTLDPAQVGMFWGVGGTFAIGRLRAGSNAVQAQSELRSLAEAMRTANPLWTPRAPYRANTTVLSLRESMVGDSSRMLLVLLGAVLLVLLIACANVGNLFLARGLGREREIALRIALGAGRARVVRQLVTESALLAFVGGVLGLLVARIGLDALLTLLPVETPRLSEVRLDTRILAATLAISVLAGVAFGMLPALRVVSARLRGSLESGGRTMGGGVARRRLSSGLVIGEVALAVVLITGAGLLGRTLRNLAAIDPGFAREHAIAARISPPPALFETAERRLALYDVLLREIAALPGVRAAALTRQLPFDGEFSQTAAAVEFVADDPNELPTFEFRAITPEYFATMDIPLIVGRAFTSADRAGGLPVAIVDRTTAERFWPDQSALGKRIGRPWMREWRTVVGVAGAVRNGELTSEPTPALYVPLAQEPSERAVIVLRTELPVAATAAALRAAVARVDANVPVSDVRTLDMLVTGSTAQQRAAAILIAVFAGLAMVLGAVGLYGLLAYGVTQRTREIGVRVALGATRADVLRLIIRNGIVLGAAGLAVGIPSAIALSRLLSGLLYGVQPADPLNLAVVSLVLMFACLLATAVPALRASRVQPSRALRE